MSREKKFNFTPLRIQMGRMESDSGQPWVRIGKNHVMFIGLETLTWLGFHDKEMFSVQLLEDLKKRTLGFRITKEVGKKENGYRVVKIKRYPSPKGYTSVRADIAINSFLRQLKGVKLPSGRLDLEVYVDNDEMIQMGKVYYITIPYDKESE